MDMMKELTKNRTQIEEALLKRMVQDGIGKMELCAAIGISSQTFNDFLDGKDTVSIKTVLKIIKYLGIDYE